MCSLTVRNNCNYHRINDSAVNRIYKLNKNCVQNSWGLRNITIKMAIRTSTNLVLRHIAGSTCREHPSTRNCCTNPRGSIYVNFLIAAGQFVMPCIRGPQASGARAHIPKGGLLKPSKTRRSLPAEAWGSLDDFPVSAVVYPLIRLVKLWGAQLWITYIPDWMTCDNKKIEWRSPRIAYGWQKQ